MACPAIKLCKRKLSRLMTGSSRGLLENFLNPE